MRLGAEEKVNWALSAPNDDLLCLTRQWMRLRKKTLEDRLTIQEEDIRFAEDKDLNLSGFQVGDEPTYRDLFLCHDP